MSDEGTVLWDFETDKVSENITLYAVWVQNVSVVFDANGGKFKHGESKYTVELTVGDVVTAPSLPKISGIHLMAGIKTVNSLKPGTLKTILLPKIPLFMRVGWQT